MQTKVNIAQCKKAGLILKNYSIDKDFFNRDFIFNDSSPELKARAIFYSVAICHQTYNLRDEDRNLFGWDFIEDRFYHLMHTADSSLKPGYFSNLSIFETENFLQNLFSVTCIRDNCTLDRLNERSRFLKETDSFFENLFNGSTISFINSTDGHLLNNKNDYDWYNTLSKLEAFSDPHKKKISFLVKLLTDAGLLVINSYDDFIPIMDYHMQRVLLRLGCIEIMDKNLYKSLVSQELTMNDSEIRETCIEAIRIISTESDKRVDQMNDIIWPFGRSCCNIKPVCRYGECEKHPCSLSKIITEVEPKHKCILNEICYGFKDDIYFNLWQPNIITHYY